MHQILTQSRASLKFDEKVENENYQKWRAESVKTLPAAVFVWFEELSDAYKESLPEAEVIGPENRSRPGDRDLNLSPFIPSALRDEVYEGFEPSALPAHSGRGGERTTDACRGRVNAGYRQGGNATAIP